VNIRNRADMCMLCGIMKPQKATIPNKKTPMN
jgi:hypothetical protein